MHILRLINCICHELAKSVVEFNTVPATYKSEASVRGSEVRSIDVNRPAGQTL
jgi:hypothetical protein